MAGNRKKAEAFILEYIEKLLPGSDNTKLWDDYMSKLSDKEFDDFMTRLETGEQELSLIAPNFGKTQLEVSRNLKIAEELGHEFFERIWLRAGDDTPPYLSPIKYLIVDLPLRRQAQLLTKKISIPENNKSIDDMSGQPTGASKGSKISYPELQILAAKNLDNCLTEFMKYRGGDLKGFNAMNDSISKTGAVKQESIAALGSTVKSTDTLHVFLTCMHLSNTL